MSKTTTALNLGYALSTKGYKVLLVDFYSQSNLTMCFGVDKPDELDTMSVIEDEEFPDESQYLIRKDNMDLMLASIELSAVEVNLVNAMSREVTLRTIIDEVRDNYDYIIIDCMPSLGMLTINALVACDSVLITATPT